MRVRYQISPASVLCSAALLLWTSGVVSPRAGAQAIEPAVCTHGSGQIRAVARVIDAQTLALDDGTEVRLSGILAPLGQDHGSDALAWAPEREARDALKGLLAGGRIELSGDQIKHDRYGRVLAHAMTTLNGQRTWIQGTMVSQGHARATADQPGSTCGADLLIRERDARRAKRGLWANPAYDVRHALKTRDLLTAVNTFQLIEGRVAAVAETKNRVYLNFGENWKWDFTASLPLRRTADRDQTVKQLKALQGQSVRVRGWIERRNGPLVELTSAGDIEIVE